jgi:hypothetical protein
MNRIRNVLPAFFTAAALVAAVAFHPLRKPSHKPQLPLKPQLQPA